MQQYVTATGRLHIIPEKGLRALDVGVRRGAGRTVELGAGKAGEERERGNERGERGESTYGVARRRISEVRPIIEKAEAGYDDVAPGNELVGRRRKCLYA